MRAKPIGEVLTKKNINRGATEVSFTNIWDNPKGFKVEELRPRPFQFFFRKEEDLQRVLDCGPWIFRNSLLILEKRRRDIVVNEESFDKIKAWVQIWGLPPY